jgi:hypothetical protein
MTQPTIYLCYETDKWHAYSSKRLVYLGESLEDCIAQLRQEFDLEPSDCENLRNNMQTFGFEKDSELLIEEERLNCFSNNWN